MSNWTSNGNYGQTLVVGENVAHVSYSRVGTKVDISVSVSTPLFPRMTKSGFTSMAEAKAWCEQWMYFAVELLELRKQVDAMREQRQRDFQEIMTLREELHEYKYPKTMEEWEAEAE